MLRYFFNSSSVDPPEITQGPGNQSVATAADAAFRVEAKGDGLQFQWQKDERDINDNDSRFNFSRTDSATMLCIHHVQKSDKGHYRCLIKSPVEKSGKPSKQADLSVCKFVSLPHENVLLMCFFLISIQLIPLKLPKI